MFVAYDLPPVHMRVDETTAWAYLIFAGVGWTVFATAPVLQFIRQRDPLIPALLIGGLAAGLTEPITDVLGHVYWPANHPWTVITVLDRPLPFVVLLGYSALAGAATYMVYRFAQTQPTSRRLFQLYAGLTVIELLVELPFTWLKVYDYYGSHPYSFAHLGFWEAPITALCPFLGAVLVYLVADRHSGWQRAAVGLFIPAAAIFGMYMVTSWPAAVTMNSTLPGFVNWLTAALSVAVAVYLARVCCQTLPVLGAREPTPQVQRAVMTLDSNPQQGDPQCR